MDAKAYNQGVMHLVVGAFTADEVRLFRQCNMAASEAPVGAWSVGVATLRLMSLWALNFGRDRYYPLLCSKFHPLECLKRIPIRWMIDPVRFV